MTYWAGRLLCRAFHLHGMSCRGRSDHHGPGTDKGRWLKPYRLRRRLRSHLVDPWLMPLGLWLKRTGCRIVIGKGHTFTDPQPRRERGYLDCHSCGHVVVVENGQTR